MPRVTRRHFSTLATCGFWGLLSRAGLAATLPQAHINKVRRCIVLWMSGGPSQIDTFDPKPGTANGGEFQAISTSVPGIRIAEVFPKIAQQMDQLCVLRSVSSQEGEHERASYLLHTGFRRVPTFPRPSLGAVVSHESPQAEFPKYVSIGSRGWGPAYMGIEHSPFAIENIAVARDQLRGIRRKKHSLQAIQRLNQSFAARHVDEAAATRNSMLHKIEGLANTPFAHALDLSAEPSATRARYGDEDLGQACLAARRLVEIGVPFVEVRHDGWDTHTNNFGSIRRLAAEIDAAWSNLLSELQASGLLQETLVVWMGEFGRTPSINANAGRDHFPKITPVVLAGAGVQPGSVIGKTNRVGTEIVGPSHGIQDLFATIFTALGIDIEQSFQTKFDSPTSVTDSGRLIPGVLE